MLKEIILFVFSVFLVYGIYALLILISKKRLEAYKTSAEMKLLESKYHVDIKNMEFYSLARMVLMVNTLDICISAAVASLVAHWLLKFVVGFIVLVIMIVISYTLLSKYLKKRGKL